MKQVAQQNGINVAVLPPFAPPDCNYDECNRMIQGKYANNRCHDSNCLIAVTDFFRNTPGINTAHACELIKHHAHNTITEHSYEK